MANGVDAQRYNPEVPLEPNAYAKTNKLNELVDKLIKLRHTVTNAVSIVPRKFAQNFYYLSNEPKIYELNAEPNDVI